MYAKAPSVFTNQKNVKSAENAMINVINSKKISAQNMTNRPMCATAVTKKSDVSSANTYTTQEMPLICIWKNSAHQEVE